MCLYIGGRGFVHDYTAVICEHYAIKWAKVRLSLFACRSLCGMSLNVMIVVSLITVYVEGRICRERFTVDLCIMYEGIILLITFLVS